MKPLSRDKGHAAADRKNPARRCSRTAPVGGFRRAEKTGALEHCLYQVRGRWRRGPCSRGYRSFHSLSCAAPVSGHQLNPASITAESLLTGMLRVLAWEPANVHAGKYRTYVRTARPELFEELIAAGIQKAESKVGSGRRDFLPRAASTPNAPSRPSTLRSCTKSMRSISPIRPRGGCRKRRRSGAQILPLSSGPQRGVSSRILPCRLFLSEKAQL